MQMMQTAAQARGWGKYEGRVQHVVLEGSRLVVVASSEPDRHSSPRDKQQQASAHTRASSRPKKSAFSSANLNRRRGRPAHLRSPDDTPLCVNAAHWALLSL